eukprot:Nk52_evm40s210 gene=Nk52_evmTU40s210
MLLLFCPNCSNVLLVQDTGMGQLVFGCQSCPYVHAIKGVVENKRYMKMKELDDVLGGAEAWENVDNTDAECPKCEHPKAYFMMMQTRSADEPMTVFYKCCNPDCGNQWRD